MADTTQNVTADESEQIERANATGLQPVVFVHGLWLLPSSWDRWADGLRGGRLHGARARLARRSRHRRGGQRPPRGLRPQDRRAGRRPLRRRHRQAGQEAGRHRPLLRRAAHADPRRPRPVGGLGRHRSGAVPRRAAAADLGAEVGVAGARQPGQPQPRRPAHLRAVPLRLRQRRQRGRGQGALRDLRGPGARARRSSRPRPPTSTRGPRRRSTARTPSAGRC